MESSYTQGGVFSVLLDHPAIWPLLLLPFFILLLAAFNRWRPGLTSFPPPPPLVAAGSLLCIGCFVFTAWTYLRSAAFWDYYECREASVAALWLRGGPIYPGLSTEERYCAPYGPVLYLVLGLSQWLFGASVFSTKLPCIAAIAAALAVFWTVVRRQYASASVAWALTGLQAALLLVFRQVPFWSKTDPLIVLTVMLGLYAAVRRGGWWSLGLGCCLGCAVDLKPHAAAYFLPALVIAFRSGWRRRAYALCGAAAAVVAALPFTLLARQFSLGSYLAFLQVTAREGSGRGETLGFSRWVLLLAALVFVADRLTCPGRERTPEERRLRLVYRGALAAAVALVAVPGCAVGAGQAHLTPLIPSILLALGDGFAGGPARWRQPAGMLWQTLAYSGLLACGLVSCQTAWRMERFHATTSAPALACRTDMRRVLARYGDSMILTGVGGDWNVGPVFFRQEAVFAGHPIGIDVAAMMDYQLAAVTEPDVSRLLAELHARSGRLVVWLLPHGSVPFSQTNLYDSTRLVYSDAFRREFHELFKLREQSEFYDVYFPRKAASPCLVEEGK